MFYLYEGQDRVLKWLLAFVFLVFGIPSDASADQHDDRVADLIAVLAARAQQLERAEISLTRTTTVGDARAPTNVVRNEVIQVAGRRRQKWVSLEQNVEVNSSRSLILEDQSFHLLYRNRDPKPVELWIEPKAESELVPHSAFLALSLLTITDGQLPLHELLSEKKESVRLIMQSSGLIVVAIDDLPIQGVRVEYAVDQSGLVHQFQFSNRGKIEWTWKSDSFGDFGGFKFPKELRLLKANNVEGGLVNVHEIRFGAPALSKEGYLKYKDDPNVTFADWRLGKTRLSNSAKRKTVEKVTASKKKAEELIAMLDATPTPQLVGLRPTSLLWSMILCLFGVSILATVGIVIWRKRHS